MGIITIFIRDDCPYCDKVINLSKELIGFVSKHIESLGGIPDLRLQCIEAVGPMASLCIRLTGSLSVPHVFFNDEYIGDCSTFSCMFEKDKQMSPLKKPRSMNSTSNNDINDIPPYDIGESSFYPKLSASNSSASATNSSCCENLSRESIFKFQEDCCGGRLVEKLISLSLLPTPVFPPHCDAKIIKLTDKAASSSQPTLQQINDIAKMGFRSVINLTPSTTRAYVQSEADVLKNSNVSYYHVPCDPNALASSDIQIAFQTIKNAQAPVLVHDASGNLSMFLVLFDAIKSIQTDINNNIDVYNTVFQVGRELNCDLSQYKCLISTNHI